MSDKNNTVLIETANQKRNVLLEKWDPVISSSADDLIPVKRPTDKQNLAQLLENQEKYIEEATTVVAADLGTFTPILVPTVRRIFPSLVANQIVGVQPMSMPTGFAFALRYGYGGDNDTNGDATGNLAKHRGDTESNKAASDYVTGSLIAIFAGDITAGIAEGDQVRDAQSGGGNVHGRVIHVEASQGLTKVLIEMVSTTPPAYDFPIPTDGSTAVYFDTANITGRVTINLITNEAGFNSVLQNYSGPLTTAAGEVLGTEMKTMKMGIERISVTAKTRKLKAEYSLEMAQDMKSVHNLNAEAELMNILQYEIASEIDRELVDAINNNATVATSWTYGTGGPPSSAVADGQWEQEKVRTLYSRIIRESNAITIATRRGPGNFIIASPNVISALESLNNFMYSPVPNDVGPIAGVTMVGTLDNRFKVYVDTFHTDPVNSLDYVTVGYKGPSNMDTGVIFCPYIPIMMQKVTHEQTFQPALGVMTRSAICYNMLGTDNYYRKVAVNLGNSAFA